MKFDESSVKNKEEVIKAAEYLKTSRPTAVNLMFCCDYIAENLRKDTNLADADV
jgi:methylthioribose-1-phosphate isomerase